MKRLTGLALAACAASTSLLAAPPQTAYAAATVVRSDTAHHSRAGLKRQLAKVRRATARFRQPSAALKAGYTPSPTCVEMPGVGGMGFHYVNVRNVADGVLDIRKPEMLVYVPTESGLRLGAVEYFQIDADQDLHTDTDRPTLFGREFDGPMLGHEPGMPIHYDLHLWLYRHNPTGRFAQWNPTVTCAVPDPH